MKLLFFFIAISLADLCFCQNTDLKTPEIFEKIGKELTNFKIDTTTPPNDKSTRKILELLQMGAVFNIKEAIEFKLAEDRSKNDISEQEKVQLEQFFNEGQGHKNLQNAIVWIYRNHFSYDELKALTKFYKSPAGKKLSSDFPLVMMKSLIAAQQIKDSRNNKNF